VGICPKTAHLSISLQCESVAKPEVQSNSVIKGALLAHADSNDSDRREMVSLMDKTKESSNHFGLEVLKIGKLLIQHYL
jgi:hypothetical protein